MRRVFAYALLIALAPSMAQAGAWTRAKGETIVINTTSYYETDEYYNSDGVRQKQEPLLKADNLTYLEYGWRNGTTIGANLDLQYLRTQDAFLIGDPLGRDHFFGAELELFLRQKLWESGSYVISLEPLVKLPGYYYDPSEGRDETSHFDAQLGLWGGVGIDLFDHHNFFNVLAAYRYRAGVPEDQLRLDLTLGSELTPRLTLYAQLFNTITLDNLDNARFTGLGEDDYDLSKLQVSLLYELTSTVSLQAGGFMHVISHNTGGGGGVMVAIWKKF